jgi:hypothetical protein
MTQTHRRLSSIVDLGTDEKIAKNDAAFASFEPHSPLAFPLRVLFSQHHSSPESMRPQRKKHR